MTEPLGDSPVAPAAGVPASGAAEGVGFGVGESLGGRRPQILTDGRPIEFTTVEVFHASFGISPVDVGFGLSSKIE